MNELEELTRECQSQSWLKSCTLCLYDGVPYTIPAHMYLITCCHDGAEVMKETAEFERNVLFCLEYLSQPKIK